MTSRIPYNPDVRRRAKEEAAKYGASVRFDRRRKHSVIYVRLGDQERVAVIGHDNHNRHKEQSDWAAQAVRRIVKELQCNMVKPSS